MALAHNGIIRGLNSIFLQAPHLPPKDTKTIQDFLTYCQCWCESMHHHHEAEETIFFPAVEQVAKTPGLMKHNVEQHQAFSPGFDAFHKYVQNCRPEDYDGQKTKSLVDAFAGPLTQHLYDEIDTLRALDKFDCKRVREAYQRFEKSMMSTDNVRCPSTKIQNSMLTPA